MSNLFKKKCIFAASNNHKGVSARLMLAMGFFYARLQTNMRFRTPVWSVNAPTALMALDSGKGETVFNFRLKTNIFSKNV